MPAAGDIAFIITVLYLFSFVGGQQGIIHQFHSLAITETELFHHNNTYVCVVRLEDPATGTMHIHNLADLSRALGFARPKNCTDRAQEDEKRSSNMERWLIARHFRRHGPIWRNPNFTAGSLDKIKNHKNKGGQRSGHAPAAAPAPMQTVCQQDSLVTRLASEASALRERWRRSLAPSFAPSDNVRFAHVEQQTDAECGQRAVNNAAVALGGREIEREIEDYIDGGRVEELVNEHTDVRDRMYIVDDATLLTHDFVDGWGAQGGIERFHEGLTNAMVQFDRTGHVALIVNDIMVVRPDLQDRLDATATGHWFTIVVERHGSQTVARILDSLNQRHPTYHQLARVAIRIFGDNAPRVAGRAAVAAAPPPSPRKRPRGADSASSATSGSARRPPKRVKATDQFVEATNFTGIVTGTLTSHSSSDQSATATLGDLQISSWVTGGLGVVAAAGAASLRRYRRKTKQSTSPSPAIATPVAPPTSPTRYTATQILVPEDSPTQGALAGTETPPPVGHVFQMGNEPENATLGHTSPGPTSMNDVSDHWSPAFAAWNTLGGEHEFNTNQTDAATALYPTTDNPTPTVFKSFFLVDDPEAAFSPL